MIVICVVAKKMKMMQPETMLTNHYVWYHDTNSTRIVHSWDYYDAEDVVVIDVFDCGN